jgi:hypothetical protein
MKIDFRIEKPQEVEFTLTATFTLAEWQKVQKSLDTPDPNSSSTYIAHPMSTLATAIRTLVYNAEKRTEANLAENLA